MPNVIIPAPPPVASPDTSGLVTPSTQTFAGTKTFQHDVIVQGQLSGLVTASGSDTSRPLGDIAADAATAKADATSALSAWQAASVTTGMYADTAAGLAAVAESGYFSVPSAAPDESHILYRKVAGVAVEKVRYSSSTAVDTLKAVDADFAATLSQAADATLKKTAGNEAMAALVYAVLDTADRAAFGLNDAGDFVTSVLQAIEKLTLGGAAADQVELRGGEYNYELAIVDSAENVVWGVKGGARQEQANASSSETLADRNQRNLALALGVKGAINTVTERNVHRYNHLLMYGQSLSTGQEGWPALSKVARHGNLMLGSCVRPFSASGAPFTPLGSATLQPLVAGVQPQGGGALLSEAEVAALAPGNGAHGETPCEGLANFAKRLHNDYVLAANDTARLFVTTNNGVAGQTIEALSKGAAANYYQRITDAVSIIKGIANGEGVSYGVTGLFFMQGEFNYQAAFGGATDQAAYKAKLVQLRADINNDVVVLTGQARPPAFLLYQTGGSFTRDDVLLSIGMAQWEFARENAGCYLAGPVYPYTDKGGHMDPNGYRWYGNLLAKVFHRVVTLGQGWKPLSPVKVQTSGTSLVIDFHAPEPPLVWDLPYVVGTAQDYPAKGFRVTDDTGAIVITGATIVADTIVRLDLARVPGANAHVWYADQTTHGGNGCLRDSDVTVAYDSYEYAAGTGQYASANIPALVGKPYPMHNWCIAFRLPVTWSAP